MTPTFDALIDALRGLPGIGPKSAQRMALQLISGDRELARRLSSTLQDAAQKVVYCQKCRNLAEDSLCGLCQSGRRDTSIVCVVETPADVLAIEQTHRYSGGYFVLHGRLSPLDGIGPEELELDRLAARVQEESVSEVIVATNATVEGEATAHYLMELLTPLGISISRIAQGVPLGGELEYVDGNTLSEAFTARRPLHASPVDRVGKVGSVGRDVRDDEQ